MAKKKLTPAQIRFVDEYLRTSNATQSYIFAYYISQGKQEPKNVVARNCGRQLLTKHYIQEALEKKALEASKISDIADPFEVMRAWTKISRADVKDMFDSDGNVLPIPDMPENLRFCISRIGVTETITESSKGDEITRKTKTDVYFHDKHPSLNSLADVYGMKKNGTREMMSDALKESGISITFNHTINNDNRQQVLNTTSLQGLLEDAGAGAADR